MSANRRRGGSSVSQSQEGWEQCQPITGGEGAVSANHRRGRSGVSQSHEGKERCQPITGGEGAVSANHRRGSNVSQSQEGRHAYVDGSVSGSCEWRSKGVGGGLKLQVSSDCMINDF